ncbi:hypothetical protein [Shewanella violacea]|uniref:Uncharacterized protein n=1 Tax=Shewanella violacea (strain JCM 10179 / CIP 106290 / LMG 19151 / DSS12) TaxID=637905 RepID=D4ZHI8_SHEVD|nr:hypothetical protein [Shewanella violacea]BAJ01137.1 hypothetical protein SVI_1166 [Shewanella violacea DSS12]
MSPSKSKPVKRETTTRVIQGVSVTLLLAAVFEPVEALFIRAITMVYFLF